MANMQRQSAVAFQARSVETVTRGRWTVVLRYADEGQGPYLVDLSHQPRWDVQDSDLSRFAPGGVSVPETAGGCALHDGVLINRMNRTQAAVWHLNATPPPMPAESAYTDITAGGVFLALFGAHTFDITEKLTSLDFQDPRKQPPFLVQGPFCRVPCQIVVLEKDADGGGILLTCSRGYARSMLDALLDAGSAFTLRPAGEARFANWLAKMNG